MTSTLPPLVQSVSGAIGSATANCLTYPLDLVTARLQLQTKPKKKSTRDVGGLTEGALLVRKIIKKDGISALYDGILTDTGATLLSKCDSIYLAA
jgi:hypothetical protein